MNERLIEEEIKEILGTETEEDFIEYSIDFGDEVRGIKKLIIQLLQQQREEMKKEILKIGEHFVKFGEKKGVEAIDMVLAVINPPQTVESKK